MRTIDEWWMWAGITGFVQVMSYRIHRFRVEAWCGARKNEMYDGTIPCVTADPGFTP